MAQAIRIFREKLSEIMVGLTALMFLFVLGFILKRGCSTRWFA